MKPACEAFNEQLLYVKKIRSIKILFIYFLKQIVHRFGGSARKKTTLNTDCFLLFPDYMANVHTLLILLLLIRLLSCIRLNSYIFKQKYQHVTYFAYTPQTSRGYGTLKKDNKTVYNI